MLDATPRHPHFAGPPSDPTSSVDVSGTPEPAFTLLSDEPCCHDPECCGPHAGPDCEGCEFAAVVRVGDEALCLECAELSQCACGAIVPAGTLDVDSDRCPACERAAELLAARRILLVTLARAASIVAAVPRKVVAIAEGREVAA